MFRYALFSEKIKSLIKENNRPVVCYNARYNSTYTSIVSPFWWNTTYSGGPIVEQATHFVIKHSKKNNSYRK
jgi:predicted dehydrogenase